MPYKDMETRREHNREHMKLVREHKPETLPKEWEHIKEFISRDVPDTEPNKMPYLERLQRIAGSLGHNAGEVWFGGLTVCDIAGTIGVLPPRY